jgi:VWFA-related protein
MIHSLPLCAVFLAAAAFALGPAAFSQNPATTPPDIHIKVDRVNVGIVVTDSRGRFVSDLRRSDFHLFDNGSEQPVTDFLSTDEPAQILILVEAGPAVYLLENGHLEALQALLDGLSPSDRIAIARYNESAEPILDFTADKSLTLAAVDHLHFNLGFGQLNLASSLATALDWLSRVPGKKSLILLSSGIDTSPATATQNLVARLKTSDVRVLTISLGGELRGASPADAKKKHSNKDQPPSDKAQAIAEQFAQADDELRGIAEANGGRAYFPRSAKDFSAVYAEIAQIVRHEYNLGFVPPARDGKLHSIDVRIAASSAAASSGSDSSRAASGSASVTPYRIAHRQAYIAPSMQTD